MLLNDWELKMLFILFFTLIASSAAECPDSWFSLGRYCYHVSTARMDWGSSEQVPWSKPYFHINFVLQYCWSIAGGYLAEFESLEEELAVESVLSIDNNYWIGLSDFAQEGTWRWHDSHKEPSYTNWGPGEPDNHGGDENCANKEYRYYGGKWNDQGCSEVNDAHALCQMEKL